MHSKFKVNILPTKGHTLPKIRPMLTAAGIDAKLYTLKNLERGNGIYALVSDISVTRQILASLEASLAPAAGYFYLVDSPRLSTIVVKGIYLKTKEGEPISMSSIVDTIHTTNSTSGVVAASRMRNKNQQPTNALKVIFLGDAPTKASQLGLQGRKPSIEAFVPRPTKCRKCHGFHFTSKCRAEQPKCAKCSGSHETSSCTTAIKRCPNCGGPHSANWQGCPSFKTQKAANYVKATEGLSYAAALTKVKVMQDSCMPIIPKPVQVKPTVPEANTEDPFVPLSQVMGLITKHVPEIICRTFAKLVPQNAENMRDIVHNITADMVKELFPAGQVPLKTTYARYNPADWQKPASGSAKAPSNKESAKAKPQGGDNSASVPRSGVTSSHPKSGGKSDTSKAPKPKKSSPKPQKTANDGLDKSSKAQKPKTLTKSSSSRKLAYPDSSKQIVNPASSTPASKKDGANKPIIIPLTPQSRKRTNSENNLSIASPLRRRRLNSSVEGEATYSTHVEFEFDKNPRVAAKQTHC